MKQFFTIVSLFVSFSSFAQIGAITGSRHICVGGTTTLSDTTTGGTWTSSTPAVATIDASTGLLTTIAEGSTAITYTVGTGSVTTTVYVDAVTVYMITGGGNFCAGYGVHLGLSGSDASVNYQVYLGTTLVGSPIFGTGAPLDFGLVTLSGVYTVKATDATTGCIGHMTGSVAAVANPLPAAFTVTGGGSYCADGTSSSIGVSLSQTGVRYQLMRGLTPVGSPIAGTGSAISFSPLIDGTYSIVGTNVATGCSQTMIGTGVVATNTLPSQYMLTGGGAYCTGGTGVHVGLSGSQAGINYQIFSASSPVGAPMLGTGFPIDFGLMTMPITYSVMGVDPTTGCTNPMLGSATITMFSGACSGIPAAGSATASGLSVCPGNPVTLSLSSASCGTTFQWQSAPTAAGPWTNIVGATSVPYGYSATATASAYYQCRVTCSSSGLSATSIPVHVSVTNGINQQIASNPTGTSCDSPNIYISTCAVSANYSVTTFFGDETSDSRPLTTSSPCHANVPHYYRQPGTYQIKQILADAGVPVDSSSFSYHYVACNYLPVYLYMDVNRDCSLDSTDYFLSQPVKIGIDSNGILIDSVYATSGIYYKAFGPAGTVYGFRNLTSAVTYVSCPSSGILYDTIAATMNNYSAKYMGFTCSSSPSFDLTENTTIPVTGIHDQWGDIYVSNRYCTPANAIVTLHFSPKYRYTGGADPVPTSISANTLTWNFSGVSSSDQQSRHIHYIIWNSPAGLAPIGDTTQTYITVTPASGTDWDTSNNTQIIIDTIKASCDPNEITVSPADYVLPCARLQYTIDFENTGNAPAQNIYVMDTLSDYLDPHSIEILSASARMENTIIREGSYTIVKFDFPDIMLPDSTHPAECNGSVVFSIKTKTGIPDGSPISNHAGIFFDDNPVVLTNVVENTLGLGPITGVANICAGSQITLYNTTTSGTWSSSGPGVAPIGSATGTATGIMAGTANITYSVTNACSTKRATAPISIIANPAPITGAAALCNGTSTAMSDTGTGTWGSSNTSVGAISSSGVVNGLLPGITIITYSVASGCSTQKYITINPSPAAITGVSNLCSGTTATFSDAGGGTWQSNNTAIATVSPTSGMVSGISPGTATITYSLPTGCFTTTPIVIDPLPASYTVTGGGHYCAGGSGLPIGLSGSQSGVLYQLLAGGAPTGSPVSGTGSAVTFGAQTASGSYTVTGSNATSTCNGAMTGSSSIMIDSLLLPSVSLSNDAPVTLCSGTLVNFAATATNQGSSPSYQWKVNSTTVASSPTYSYVPTNADVVSLSLTSSAPCASPTTVNASQTMSVITPGALAVNITASPGLTVKVGQPVTFTATIPGTTGALSYQWYINSMSVPAATDNTFTPSILYNGDVVMCEVNGNAPCPQNGSGTVSVALITGVGQVVKNGQLHLAPNPNNGCFSLTGVLPATETFSYSITNTLGQAVYSNTSTTRNGRIDEHFDLSHLAAGSYLMSVLSATGNNFLHFVIVK